MPQLLDDALLPVEPELLRLEVAELDSRLDQCEELIKRLMAEETDGSGKNNAAAIHEAKQRKMMLRYQRDVRRVRLNMSHPV